MAIMNNLRGKLTQASQSTVQKAKGLSELAKLNSTISNAENQISELYTKIGYEIYRAYFETPLPEVADLFKQVNDLHRTIETCKAQITAINAADTCPNCGAKVRNGMAFCSACGQKLLLEEQSVAVQTSFCSNCGAQVSADSIFCTSCGQKIS